MQNFPLHTIESAPENARQTLQAMQQRFGFLPNVMATMAENPVLLNGFVGSFGGFHSGSLDECEKQTLLLTNAVAFQCPWTVAAHSTFALHDGMSKHDVDAIRAGALPNQPKFAALSTMAKALIEKTGRVTKADIDAFTSAGYSQAQIFEVVFSIGISTITAMTANLAKTPVEERFKAQTWVAA